MIRRGWTVYAALLTAAIVAGEARNVADGVVDARSLANWVLTFVLLLATWGYALGRRIGVRGYWGPAFGVVSAATALAATATAASAGLSVRDFYTDAALSVDALGVSGAGSGQLQADVASGSTVLKAYLYTSDVWGGGIAPVKFQGVDFNQAMGTLLAPNANPANTVMYDVTSIVKPVIDGGSGGIYNFTLQEMGNNDGSVLVVVYRNATTTGGTAIVLDGELATGGDTTTRNFAGPYTSGDFIMSLASSFSRNAACLFVVFWSRGLRWRLPGSAVPLNLLCAKM